MFPPQPLRKRVARLPEEDSETTDTDSEPSLSECLGVIRSHPRPTHFQPLLPMKTRRSSKLTVVLDLDETLVHTELRPVSQPDHVVELEGPNGLCRAYVCYRPGLQAFLAAGAELFEFVLFTASDRTYASQVMNKLDPARTLVKHRLYREHCVPVRGMFVKDLNVLGRDMAQTVIVDNSLIAFAMNLANGIPILGWFNDPHDRELYGLFEFLQRLQQVPDVRPCLQAIYKLT